MNDQLRARAQQIALVIFDVDGVLTTGQLMFTENGDEIKAFYAQDGLGMKHLQKHGVQIAIITGRSSQIVARRMQELGIEHVYQGRDDKLAAYAELREKLQLSDDQVCYAGDDVIDLPVMEQVGLAICVPNAHPHVKSKSHWETPRAGGFGAARDVCDLLLESRGQCVGPIGVSG